MLVKKINTTESTAVEAVKAEMEVLGTPTIRAFDYDGIYYAIEGSHRIQAAKELGLGVEIEVVEYNDDVICGLDLDDSAITEAPASEVWDYIYDADGDVVEF